MTTKPKPTVCAVCSLLILFTIILCVASCASAPKAVSTDSGVASSDPAAPGIPAEPAAAAKTASGKTKDALFDDGMKFAEAASRPEPMVRSEEGISIAGPSRSVPSESGLKAGYSDDNDQFNYFVKFLDQYRNDVVSYPLAIGERIILSVRDSHGKPVGNAEIAVKAGNKTVSTGKTYASGVFHLYPLEYPDAASYLVQVSYGKERKTVPVDRKGPRNIEIRLDSNRKSFAQIPLDICFILDTTGSMGGEIERLRSTIEIINANLTASTPKPLVRFALVLYRDAEDEYVTETVPFTSDLEAFRKKLESVSADGGGDTPEDLQSALSDAITGLDWNRDGIRLAYTITDAEPHLDYGQSYTYAQAAREAKEKGIKLHSVGTGGLPLQGEYILRQISQFTAARYIFLTYGEKGESDGGTETSVSHHTGSNFQTDKLEAIIIRFTREELAYLGDVPLQADDPYFDAKKIRGEDRDATLSKLFGETLQNLADYSSWSVGKDTRAVFLPIGVAEADSTADLRRQAEYFGESLLLSAMTTRPFIIVERKDLQKLTDEQTLQYSGYVDDETAVRLGAYLGGEVMVTGRLYEKAGQYELFLKLLRVETAEILSVSRAKLSRDLGL